MCRSEAGLPEQGGQQPLSALRVATKPGAPAPSTLLPNLCPEELLESKRSRHLSQQDLILVSWSFFVFWSWYFLVVESSWRFSVGSTGK